MPSKKHPLESFVVQLRTLPIQEQLDTLKQKIQAIMTLQNDTPLFEDQVNDRLLLSFKDLLKGIIVGLISELNSNVSLAAEYKYRIICFYQEDSDVAYERAMAHQLMTVKKSVPDAKDFVQLIAQIDALAPIIASFQEYSEETESVHKSKATHTP